MAVHADQADPPQGLATAPVSAEAATVWGALDDVIDPELGVPVTDLGLIYDVTVDGDVVHVVMTTTTPVCPLGSYLQQQVESRLCGRQVTVEITHEPLWTPEMMNDRARRLLGWEPR